MWKWIVGIVVAFIVGILFGRVMGVPHKGFKNKMAYEQRFGCKCNNPQWGMQPMGGMCGCRGPQAGPNNMKQRGCGCGCQGPQGGPDKMMQRGCGCGCQGPQGGPNNMKQRGCGCGCQGPQGGPDNMFEGWKQMGPDIKVDIRRGDGRDDNNKDKFKGQGQWIQIEPDIKFDTKDNGDRDNNNKCRCGGSGNQGKATIKVDIKRDDDKK
ncbi:MAG: hypothetical protein V1701_01360 [Planctomycetota bacterium]